MTRINKARDDAETRLKLDQAENQLVTAIKGTCEMIIAAESSEEVFDLAMVMGRSLNKQSRQADRIKELEQERDMALGTMDEAIKRLGKVVIEKEALGKRVQELNALLNRQ